MQFENRQAILRFLDSMPNRINLHAFRQGVRPHVRENYFECMMSAIENYGMTYDEEIFEWYHIVYSMESGQM